MAITAQSGDTFYNLWLKYGRPIGMDYSAFKAANPHLERGKNYNLIYPGDTINVGQEQAAPQGQAQTQGGGGGGGSSALPSDLYIQPGLWLQLQQEQNALQKYIADQSAAEARRNQELTYAANPLDTVAYEMYLRDLTTRGLAPFTRQPRSDADMQAAFAQATGIALPSTVNQQTGTPEGSIGYSRFGVPIPRPQLFTREGLANLSEEDKALISSFLQAGVHGQNPSNVDKYTSLNPADYFNEIQKGLVPALPGAESMMQYIY